MRPVVYSKGKPLSGHSEEKNFIIEQLHILLNAGMDLSTALETLIAESQSKALKGVIQRVKDRVDGGSPLWSAFQGTGIIPEQFLSFIRTGEESGKLKEQLKMVAEQYAREKEFRSKVVAASVYPIFILLVVLVLGGANLFIILPQVTDSFLKLGAELPPVTLVMLNMGTFVKQYGYIVGPAVVGFIVLTVYFLFYSPKTKYFGQELMFRLPGIGNVYSQVELSKFGYIFGLLSTSGITMTEALSFLAEYTTTKRYQWLYQNMREGIENGQRFYDIFAEYPKIDRILPRSVQNLITSSEKSGHMPETLMKIGEIYQKKLDISTQTLSAVIEPLLIIIVWFFVLVVALAIIYPLYSMIGSISSY